MRGNFQMVCCMTDEGWSGILQCCHGRPANKEASQVIRYFQPEACDKNQLEEPYE